MDWSQALVRRISVSECVMTLIVATTLLLPLDLRSVFLIIALSFANKKARLSVLVRGARLCHALLKALDSPLNYLARRHPKLKGHRLASHVSAFRRSKFSRDKVCKSLADPVGPPGGGSRHRAILQRSSKRSEISIPNRRRLRVEKSKLETFYALDSKCEKE